METTNNIVFEPVKTLKDIAIETALEFSGSTELPKQMKRLKVDYTKVIRGVNTIYVLRSKEFGRIEVKL